MENIVNQNAFVEDLVCFPSGESILEEGKRFVQFKGPARIEDDNQKVHCKLMNDQILMSHISRLLSVFCKIKTIF
jgi:hypothetical protein